MSDINTLEDLLDLERIRMLKHRYFRFVDTKDWDGVASCFVPEATAAYPDQACASRDEIVAFLSTAMVPGLVSLHQGHHPEISLDGEVATGIWYLHDKIFVPAYEFNLEGSAFYTDRYVRRDGQWLMTHTGYERVFETSWKTGDPTSFKIKQGDVSKGRAVVEAE